MDYKSENCRYCLYKWRIKQQASLHETCLLNNLFRVWMYIKLLRWNLLKFYPCPSYILYGILKAMFYRKINIRWPYLNYTWTSTLNNLGNSSTPISIIKLKKCPSNFQPGHDDRLSICVIPESVSAATNCINNPPQNSTAPPLFKLMK